MEKGQVKRGEVYWLDLSDDRGSVLAGTHPVLVVQNDLGNQHSAVTIVSGMTTKRLDTSYPFHVHVQDGDVVGLKAGTVQCEQVFSVNVAELRERIAVLPGSLMSRVDRALCRSLGLTYRAV
jgi:mRNA interferase MazF